MSDRNQIGVVSALGVVGFVSVFFWRGVQEAFDLVKATSLWTGGTAVLLLGLLNYRALTMGLPKALKVSIAAFLIACTISALLVSDFRWTSFWGQNQRYTGLLTFIFLVAIMVVLSSVHGSSHYISSFFAALLLVSTAYVLLQYSGRDPFEWNTVGFGNPTFGTIGNPNTAAGFAVMVTPFSLAVGLDLRRHYVLRVTGLFLCFFSLISIEILDSFQANIAALILLIFPFYWFRRIPKFSTSQILGLAGLTLLIVLLPNVNGYVSAKVIAAILLSPVLAKVAFIREGGLAQNYRRRSLLYVGGFVTFGTLLLMFAQARQLVASGWNSGLAERGDFYRAAWSIFASNPVFGTGLESFGYFFTEYRPASHALRLEGSRTSSAHNIFLGMFANGGVVLGFAYLLLIASLVWLAVKRLQTRKPLSFNQLAVLLSFCVFQIISLVTVEHVVLFTVAFAVNGLMIAHFRPEAGSANSRTRRKRLENNRHLPGWGVGVVVGCALLFSMFTVWRPIRAAQAAIDGLKATSIGQRLEENRRATDLAPWEGMYWVSRAETELALERTDEAVVSIQRALEELNYSASFAPDGARVLAQLGRFDLSLPAIQSGIRADPFAPEATSELLLLLDAIEDAATSSSDQLVLNRVYEVRASLPDHLSAGSVQLP